MKKIIAFVQKCSKQNNCMLTFKEGGKYCILAIKELFHKQKLFHEKSDLILQFMLAHKFVALCTFLIKSHINYFENF